jgi:hypothetical protein
MNIMAQEPEDIVFQNETTELFRAALNKVIIARIITNIRNE